jgi:hypothetical protein
MQAFVLTMAPTSPGLKLYRESDHVWRVSSEPGGHVGNLKLINGVWRFKAIGYDASGAVMPGHGPLTQHHNQRFEVLDEALIFATLGKG